MIQNSFHDWERTIGGFEESDEKLMNMFTSHPAYLAFYETYPDAKEEFQNRNRGNGNLNVGVMNFETGDQIILDMYSEKHMFMNYFQGVSDCLFVFTLGKII